MLDHFLDQADFEAGFRLVLQAQGGEQGVEFALRFPGQHLEAAAEAVLEIVLRDDGFAVFGFGPVECCAFAWFAFIWASDAISGAPNEKRRKSVTAHPAF